MKNIIEITKTTDKTTDSKLPSEYTVGKIEFNNSWPRTPVYPDHFPKLPDDVTYPWMPKDTTDQFTNNFMFTHPNLKKHRTIEIDKTTRQIEVKIPGLSKTEIEVSVDFESNIVSVAITPKEVSFHDCEGFVFPLKKYEEVQSATMKDGILYLFLVTETNKRKKQKIKIK